MATRRIPVTCDICHKQINRKGDLGRHKLTHRQNADELKIPCPYAGCNYRTFQSSNLATHINIHTGKRPYKCPDCGGHFSDPSCVTRHREDHHGYTPRKNSRNKQKGKKIKRHAPYTIPTRSSDGSSDTIPAPSTSSSSSPADPALDTHLTCPELPQDPLAYQYAIPDAVASTTTSLPALEPSMVPTWGAEWAEVAQTEQGSFYTGDLAAQPVAVASFDKAAYGTTFSEFPFHPSSDLSNTRMPLAGGYDEEFKIANAPYDYLDGSPDALLGLVSAGLFVLPPTQYLNVNSSPTNMLNTFTPSVGMYDEYGRTSGSEESLYAYQTEGLSQGTYSFSTQDVGIYPQEVGQTSHTARLDDEGSVSGGYYLPPYSYSQAEANAPYPIQWHSRTDGFCT